MAPPAVTVENLRVEIDGRPLVDGVSLTAGPGRCVALLGPSGSGKSTTGLALLAEYPPGALVTGTVRTAGRVGYVPQQPAAALNPARRVGALLTDIARLGGGSRAQRASRVRDALRAAQLPHPDEILRRFPHELSGGQQQRVVLAQALLSGARAVVADEPTTGQDPLTKRRVVAELRALLRQDVAVVLLSHDIDVVRALADEVVILRAGRVVEAGPTAEVFAAPRHEWTKEMLAADLGATSGPRLEAAPPTALAGRGPAAPTLTAHQLTAWHGRRREGTTVLRDATLDLAPGECLAVVGRSGAGKTTLARCLAGLHRRWSGRLEVDGRPLPRSLRERGPGELAAVQYVFQDARASFDEFRPVLDQVARTAVRLRGLPPGEARAEARTALARMGITADTAGRRPPGLSGGELQRAALARALLAQPRVLVCDEITSGLDPVTRRDVSRLLHDLTRSSESGGTSLVLITHDLAVAAELADRIAVVEAGEVVEQGPAGTVLRDPAHPFTRRLVVTSRQS